MFQTCTINIWETSNIQLDRVNIASGTKLKIELTILLHIISYHIISYHIISYHIISYHIISYHIISYHIISYHIISYHIISYHIISYHIISWLTAMILHLTILYKLHLQLKKVCCAQLNYLSNILVYSILNRHADLKKLISTILCWENIKTMWACIILLSVYIITSIHNILASPRVEHMNENMLILQICEETMQSIPIFLQEYFI